MKKIILILALFFSCFGMILPVKGQTPVSSSTNDNFFRGEVMNVVRTGIDDVGNPFQDLRVRFKSGDDKGTEKEIRVVNNSLQAAYHLTSGDEIIVLKDTRPDGSTNFSVVDLYRLPKVLFLLGIFFLIILLVLGKKRGFFSLLALAWTVVILMFFIVPRISAGNSPFLVSIVGSFLIVAFSILVAHGFNRRTIIGAVGTLLTLIFSVVIGYLSIKFTRLFGMGSEDAGILLLSPLGHIDLSGLLLAGITIGALGVLDDVTTAQAAAVEEIHEANKSFSPRELYTRGMSVGKEHIIALVNTLFLAYAGASLPVLLLLSVYHQPLWVTLSGEMIVEEIVRTLAGSVSLIVAVPVTTALAAFLLSKKQK